MNSENDLLLPDEGETQSLNKMAAQIKSMDSRLEVVETKVDAQSKHTNANLLSAFAEILKDALAHQKAEFSETLTNALAHQKAEFSETLTNALAHQKAEFSETLTNALAQLKAEFNETLTNALAQQKAELKAELKAEFAEMLKQELEPIKQSINKVETRMGYLEKEMASLRIAFRGAFTDFVFIQDKLETRLNNLEENRTQ